MIIMQAMQDISAGMMLHIKNLSLNQLHKFCIFQYRLYMIEKKTLPKSTCPIGNFTYLGPSGSGIF